MSTLDQPLLIANSNYHAGQLRSIYVAEERGYFREEGLTTYDLDQRGLIPGPLEREGLGLVMREHGTDVAVAVDVRAAIYQCSQSDDLFIVGGWRYDGPAGTKWYASADVSDLSQLRGRRIGLREHGSLGQDLFTSALRRSGIDSDRDVEWVYSEAFYTGGSTAVLDQLRDGVVDVVRASVPMFRPLEEAGYKVIYDPNLPGGRPGKVIVATRKTIEQREDELTAFLSANTRAFWFIRDVTNFDYMRELDVRIREHSHNEYERGISLAENAEFMERSPMPVDGGISRTALEQVIDEMVQDDRLDDRIPLVEVLRDGPVVRAVITQLPSQVVIEAEATG